MAASISLPPLTTVANDRSWPRVKPTPVPTTGYRAAAPGGLPLQVPANIHTRRNGSAMRRRVDKQDRIDVWLRRTRGIHSREETRYRHPCQQKVRSRTGSLLATISGRFARHSVELSDLRKRLGLKARDLPTRKSSESLPMGFLGPGGIRNRVCPRIEHRSARHEIFRRVPRHDAQPVMQSGCCDNEVRLRKGVSGLAALLH